jgi:Protein of unknown function (DUF3892)
MRKSVASDTPFRSALAKEALRWMIDQTGPMGVRYVARTVRSLVLGQGAATNSAGKAYVAPDGSGRADIGVVRAAGHAPFLRTYADGYWSDNLLANQCPL